MSTTHEQERTEEQVTFDVLVMERVKRGMALLEREHGPDWVEKLDLATLELTDGAACVLGQLYAEKADSLKDSSCGYTVGTQKLFPNRYEDTCCDDNRCDPVALHGFTLNEDEEIDENWELLQDCWLAALTPTVRRGG